MKRSTEELDDLLQVIDELLKRGIPVYSFIQNIQGSFVTIIEDKSYILLEVTEPRHEYGILDMMERNNELHLRTQKRILYRNEWARPVSYTHLDVYKSQLLLY